MDLAPQHSSYYSWYENLQFGNLAEGRYRLITQKRGKMAKRSPASVSPPCSPVKKQKLDDEEEKSKEVICAKFHLKAPQDFFDVWQVAKELDPTTPLTAFKHWGMTLVGPFEVGFNVVIMLLLLTVRCVINFDWHDRSSRRTVLLRRIYVTCVGGIVYHN